MTHWGKEIASLLTVHLKGLPVPGRPAPAQRPHTAARKVPGASLCTADIWGPMRLCGTELSWAQQDLKRPLTCVLSH